MATPGGVPVHGWRVLVVEDAPEFRQLIVTALTNEGFVVEASDDGREAVEQSRSFQPDVMCSTSAFLSSTGWRSAARCAPSATLTSSCSRVATTRQ
jgi:CheY-like chemotaxis protein